MSFVLNRVDMMIPTITGLINKTYFMIYNNGKLTFSRTVQISLNEC